MPFLRGGTLGRAFSKQKVMENVRCVLGEGSVLTVVVTRQWEKDIADDFLFPGAELYLYIGGGATKAALRFFIFH